MKKFCFSLLVTLGLFLSNSTHISAQPYESYFGDSTTRWYALHPVPIIIACQYEFSTILLDYGGDTTVAGISYKKMVSNQEDHYFQGKTYLFRENLTEGRLYYLELYPNVLERVFSDMSLDINDSIVHSVSLVNNRKHIKLKSNFKNHPRWNIGESNITMIEGIGATSLFYFDKDWHFIDTPEVLLCVEKDGVEVFKHDFNQLPNTCEFDTASCYGLSVPEWSNEKLAITLYPNPNSGIFNLQFQEEISRNHQVAIYDLMGKMVFQSSFNGNRENIEVNHLPNGVYFIQIKSLDSGQIFGTERLIINK